jgi:hypothetical protein
MHIITEFIPLLVSDNLLVFGPHAICIELGIGVFHMKCIISSIHLKLGMYQKKEHSLQHAYH